MLPIACADVIVFSNYNTRAEITKEGTLHVVKELTLKNTGRSPIIPGELHFRMYEKNDKGEKASKITGFSAKGHYDDVLTIQKLDYSSQTELVIDIWEPILPGFIYNFKVEYDVEFKPKGILFYDFVLPAETTTIPIENQVYQLTVPKNKHITYTVGGKVSDNLVVWENINSPQLEYSILPMPKLPIRAVNVFWFSIILLLCFVLALKIFKRDER
jgi:hypothetical protein